MEKKKIKKATQMHPVTRETEAQRAFFQIKDDNHATATTNMGLYLFIHHQGMHLQQKTNT